MKHFVNRKTITSSEVLPSAAYLEDYITHEVDTGNLFISDGNDIFLSHGKERTEVFKNKILEVSDNSVINPNGIIDNSIQSDYEYKGGLIPGVKFDNSFYGILEDNITLYNPNIIRTTVQTTNADSVLCQFRSGEFDDKMGFTSLYPYFTRDLGFEVKAIVKSITGRFYFGFSTSTILGFSVPCIFIGFNETSSKFLVISSNGVTSSQSIPFVKDKGTDFVTVEIILKNNSIVCKLDAETIIVTNKIPGLTDLLYLHSYGVV